MERKFCFVDATVLKSAFPWIFEDHLSMASFTFCNITFCFRDSRTQAGSLQSAHVSPHSAQVRDNSHEAVGQVTPPWVLQCTWPCENSHNRLKHSAEFLHCKVTLSLLSLLLFLEESPCMQTVLMPGGVVFHFRGRVLIGLWNYSTREMHLFLSMVYSFHF